MSQHTRILDPQPIERLADYLATGGGQALEAARQVAPGALIATVEASGLRGRGGAGFPTGRKWTTIVDEGGSAPIPVVVNAAEGEPGTFKDRTLLRRNPFRVLEGAIIAALAVGADRVLVLAKSSFTHEIERLEAAIVEIVEAGWIDADAIAVITGPSEYLFGEETAMLEVVDGRPPFPRVMAPYRRGVESDGVPEQTQTDGPVALIDNVETLANVPAIVLRGADWFRSVGTADSPGTIVCTVSGDTEHAGVGEFAMGTPLSEVIETLGVGVGPGEKIAAVLGGVSSSPVPGSKLDTPISYEDMASIGSGLGSASFIVISDQTPLQAVAAGVARFLAIESCGQCEPCKRDGLAIADGLANGHQSGDVGVEDRLSTVARGARCALAGQTERVVGALLDLAGVVDPVGYRPYPIVPMVDLVDGHAVLDLAHLDKRADWTFTDEEPDSGIWPVHRLADQPVEVSRVHVPEVDPAEDDSADLDVFAPVHDLHRELEQRLIAVRHASADEIHAELDGLRHDLARHRRVTERLVYPLVDRLEPVIGADVAWYPEHREAHAARLATRLDLGTIPLSWGLIDELCADVHVSIIELDLRVLPLLERHITRDLADELQLAGDVVEEITDQP